MTPGENSGRYRKPQDGHRVKYARRGHGGAIGRLNSTWPPLLRGTARWEDIWWALSIALSLHDRLGGVYCLGPENFPMGGGYPIFCSPPPSPILAIIVLSRIQLCRATLCQGVLLDEEDGVAYTGDTKARFPKCFLYNAPRNSWLISTLLRSLNDPVRGA